MRLRRTGPALALALVASCLALTATAAHAEEPTCVRGTPAAGTQPTEGDPSDDVDPTLVALRLDEVHRIATGAGVGIAVIDSGIAASPSLRLGEGRDFASGSIVDGHGTVVAGLISGAAPATGIAPGATLYDVRVVSGRPGDGAAPTGANPDVVAAAVRWAIANRDQPIDVIHLSVGFAEPHAGLADAIREAVAAGLVVVAPAGDRPATVPGGGALEGQGTGSEAEAGPPAAPDDVLFPASMPEVLAVTARDAELAMSTSALLLGPGVDVSAPVVGMRSVMLAGLPCRVDVPTSTWAAASVSGLVALLLEQDPSLTPAQVRTRIAVTAQGGLADVATDGHGMVQPLEALTRVLDIAADGTLDTTRSTGSSEYVAATPQAPDGGHAGRGGPLLWWALGAGGVLVLALVLRPVLAGRRA
ncbi:S8 family serine peptidase [Nocardioides sp. AE5]|uniref:S8 family serine peptidase n=1 Tax=Nocardioides sp. AE5 TaxID=2962573 RepID=UPI002882B0F7|nr:S8 family serine peptidase [Nocardioides sp. AE5]MDT0200505.1 S8 family serine peptidase [Nocardioides sp. AE5]